MSEHETETLEDDAGERPKHPGGRPSKYEERFCDEVEELLAEGYSLEACAGQIGVARSTIYLWLEEHPQFSDAVKVGQSKSVLWWEQALRRVAMKGGGPGTATAVIFGLKNRAPDAWRDVSRTELTGKDGEALNVTIVGLDGEL